MKKEYTNEKIDRIQIVAERTYAIILIQSMIKIWTVFNE